MSNKDETYVQCKLRQGNRGDYSWIPKKFAVVGKAIRFKDQPADTPDWIVAETWAEKSAVEVHAMSQYYKKHRKGTDAHRDSDGGWEGPDR